MAPAVLAIDYLYYGKKASPRVTASVQVVCLGVGLATITDPQLSSNLSGLAAGFGSVAATALYQIWAGSKQKELGMGSMQLLHQYVPLAALLLGALVSGRRGSWRGGWVGRPGRGGRVAQPAGTCWHAPFCTRAGAWGSPHASLAHRWPSWSRWAGSSAAPTPFWATPSRRAAWRPSPSAACWACWSTCPPSW